MSATHHGRNDDGRKDEDDGHDRRRQLQVAVQIHFRPIGAAGASVSGMAELVHLRQEATLGI